MYEAKKGKYYNSDVKLKLTEELEFSMTEFDKVNKGLVNSNINCFMNVCLQSLLACPAFFNMLTLVGQATQESPEQMNIFKHKDLMLRCAELSRYFDPNVLKNDDRKYYNKANFVDAQEIFMQELLIFNPENIQADCSEFLSFFLDKLHEELKDIYVAN